MLCVGNARIGPVPRRWWAVAEPGGALHGASSTGRGGVDLEGRRVRVEGPGVLIDLELDTDAAEAVETASPAGPDGYIWTSKRACVPVKGIVAVAGGEYAIEGPHAFTDDSAGYHARHTTWKWSAGVGRTDTGLGVGWNAVTGIHDAEGASERTLWVDGAPRELGPVHFAHDLSRLSFSDGGELLFSEWSAREERMNLLLVRSAYRQPFGTFSGDLPGGLRLPLGHGVMEDHEVWW
jgi:hypothetical protein